MPTATVYKASYAASEAAIACLASNLSNLKYEPDPDGRTYWLWGKSLALGSNPEKWPERLAIFSRRANMIIALADPNLSAIRPAGSVRGIGKKPGLFVFPGPAIFEIVGSPVILSAKGGGPPARPLAVRADELAKREPRFERAANILAECGVDPAKLYFVMELIERAHGGFPSKKKPTVRAAFCNLIQVDEPQWEALHRTARPYRHAEPHDMIGSVLTPRQARVLIQHALKLWLEREVPI